VTLEEMDELVVQWEVRLQQASENLLALTELVTYKRLKGEGGWPQVQLTGATQTRVVPALEAMRDLWSHYALFAGVVNRAKELRDSVSRLFPSRATLEEIEHLLRGPSIKLPPVATPLAQRGLLTAAEVAESVTPERLLEAMTRSFQVARDAVLAVDAAWDRLLPLLENWECEAASLQHLADSLGEGDLREASAARRDVASLRASVLQDPLGVASRGEEVVLSLRQVRERLEKLESDRAQVRAGLDEARRLLGQLEEAHRQAMQAHAEREQKVQVDDPGGFPRPMEDEMVSALAPWLLRLESTFQDGKWRPAAVGLDKWRGIARQYLAAEEATCSANNSPLRARRDLRGLLDALQAKAQACDRAEDPALGALAREAWRLLQTRPTPLTRLQELVREYEVRLL
jgi:hypothetical protein